MIPGYSELTTLPHRKDLDRLVQINPDQAGLLDHVITLQDTPTTEGSNKEFREYCRLSNEMDLIVGMVTPAESDVLDITYSKASRHGIPTHIFVNKSSSYYRARCFGYPPDVDEFVSWDIFMEVME